VPPKTEDSSRTVPLPDFCLNALKEHAERQADERDGAPAYLARFEHQHGHKRESTHHGIQTRRVEQWRDRWGVLGIFPDGTAAEAKGRLPGKRQ